MKNFLKISVLAVAGLASIVQVGLLKAPDSYTTDSRQGNDYFHANAHERRGLSDLLGALEGLGQGQGQGQGQAQQAAAGAKKGKQSQAVQAAAGGKKGKQSQAVQATTIKIGGGAAAAKGSNATCEAAGNEKTVTITKTEKAAAAQGTGNAYETLI